MMPYMLSLAPLTYSLQKSLELTRSFLNAMFCKVLKAARLLPTQFLRKKIHYTWSFFRIICRQILFQVISAGIHKIRYSLLLTGWFCSSFFLSRFRILAQKRGECCVFSGCYWSPSLVQHKLIFATDWTLNSLHEKD